jgi:aspartate/glutamate racemase
MLQKQYGINIVIPDKEKQDYIHTKYMTELVLTRSYLRRLIQIIKRVKEKESIEGDLGGKSSLILKQSDFEDIKIFNTTEIWRMCR